MNLSLRIGKILILIFVISIFLIDATMAAKVGIVINFPEEVYKKCVDIDEKVDAYDLLNKLNLDVTWSNKGIYGHALCKINGIGDEVSGYNCRWGNEYWAFYIMERGEWLYSPVGFDGGGCWNKDTKSFAGHYCTKDQDVIGLIYGKYGNEPDLYSYEEICLDKSRTWDTKENVKNEGGDLQIKAEKKESATTKSHIFIILSVGILLFILIYLIGVIKCKRH